MYKLQITGYDASVQKSSFYRLVSAPTEISLRSFVGFLVECVSDARSKSAKYGFYLGRRYNQTFREGLNKTLLLSTFVDKGLTAPPPYPSCRFFNNITKY